MLVAVGVLIAGPLMLYAASNVTSNAMSYQDFIELQNKRVAQNVVITHSQHNATSQEIHIHIVNTGLEDIMFSYVLINGVPLEPDNMSGNCWDPNGIKTNKGYCFYNSTSGTNLKNENTTLPINSNIRLGITYQLIMPPPTENTIQLVTDAFKLFEITL